MKIKRRRTTTTRSDAGYIRKLCKKQHPEMSIRQEALEDLNSITNEVFDMIAQGSTELLRLKHIPKATMGCREMETYAELHFNQELFEEVVELSRAAVLKFTSYIKPEPVEDEPVL